CWSVSRPASCSTLFPYTTLFRSQDVHRREGTGVSTQTTSDVPEAPTTDPILTVRDLSVDFFVDGEWHNAAKSMNYEVYPGEVLADRKSTRLNSSHVSISYAVFCL